MQFLSFVQGNGQPHVSPSQRLSGADVLTNAHSNVSPSANVSPSQNNANSVHPQHKAVVPSPQQSPQLSAEERQRFQNHLQRQLNQISGAGGGGPLRHPPSAEPFQARHHHENQAKFQRPFVDGDFEFVSVSFEHFQKLHKIAE